MMITTTFDNLDELLFFANQLAAGGAPVAASASEPAPVSVPVQAAAPVTPATIPTAPPVTPVPATPPATPVQQSVPTVTQTYTLDDLARAAMTLMDAGRQPDLLQLLGSFGVESLPGLPPAQYGAFATALRGLGAQI